MKTINMVGHLSEYDCIEEKFTMYGWNREEMLDHAGEYMDEFNNGQVICESIERFRDCINDFFDGLISERNY